MNQNIKTVGIAIFGVAILAIAYQALVVVPNNQSEAILKAAQMKIDEEQRVQLRKKIDYDSCISNAYNNYSANWDSKCELLGKEKDCSLARYEREDIEETHSKAEDRCVTLYQ